MVHDHDVGVRQHDGALRALPRSQIRSDSAGGLLQPAGRIRRRGSRRPAVRSRIRRSTPARRALLAKRRAVMVQLRPLQDEAASASSPEIEEARRDAERVEDGFRGDARSPRCSRRSPKLRQTARRMVQALLNPADARRASERLTAELQAVDTGTGAVAASRSWSMPRPIISTRKGHFTFAIEPRPITVLQRGSVESPGQAGRRRARFPACLRLPSRFALKRRRCRRRAPGGAGALDHRPRTTC